MLMAEKFFSNCVAVGVVVFILLLVVRFDSVPCGGDTIEYFFVCRKDLFAYF
jgi:hypothetical protein